MISITDMCESTLAASTDTEKLQLSMAMNRQLQTQLIQAQAHHTVLYEYAMNLILLLDAVNETPSLTSQWEDLKVQIKLTVPDYHLIKDQLKERNDPDILHTVFRSLPPNMLL